jgi:hypothetical protein
MLRASVAIGSEPAPSRPTWPASDPVYDPALSAYTLWS